MKGTQPDISVVLPVYNNEDTIRRAVESVLNQTCPSWELIVIDDGSTDHSRKVLEEYLPERRLRYIFQKHQGAAVARNRGIEIAQGEFITFQDSDDQWHPDKLEKQREVFSVSASSLGVVYSDMLRIGEVNKPRLFKAPREITGTIIDPRTCDYETFGIGIQSVMIKRHFLKEIDGFDVDLSRFIDLDLLLRLTRVCDFYHLPEPCVNYFVTKGISANNDALVAARKSLLQKYFEEISANQHYLAYQYMKIAEALWKSGLHEESKDYCTRSLRTYPYSMLLFFKAFIMTMVSANVVAKFPEKIRRPFY